LPRTAESDAYAIYDRYTDAYAYADAYAYTNANIGSSIHV
jgi:hypothetical protein